MTPQEILARYKAIAITLHPDPVPLRLDETNTLRVTGSRITLDILIEHHKEGWAPERIVEALDTLQLGDVYSILGYYYRHQAELDEYLRQRNELADLTQREIEASQGPFLAEMKERRSLGRPEESRQCCDC